MVSNQIPTNLPEVTDDDIRWVSALLGLKANAFYGVDGKDPRQDALKSMETVDIAACPGSGKTTLLVAKLAILAKKWPYQTQGLCVLSHTNAAQDEIESKLGGTAVGRCLLSYPHYVGTIHGFVNKFLSLPMLRSYGFANIHFSNEISGAKLWRLSSNGRELKSYLKENFKKPRDHQIAVKSIHYVGENLDICLKATRSVCLRRISNSSTFKVMNEWKKAILRDGFAVYDDIIAYGQFVLKTYPGIEKIIRDRFPIIFIDEAQDNNEEQAALLHRIFTTDDSPVFCQRFGDANQAIYNSVVSHMKRYS